MLDLKQYSRSQRHRLKALIERLWKGLLFSSAVIFSFSFAYSVRDLWDSPVQDSPTFTALPVSFWIILYAAIFCWACWYYLFSPLCRLGRFIKTRKHYINILKKLSRHAMPFGLLVGLTLIIHIEIENIGGEGTEVAINVITLLLILGAYTHAKSSFQKWFKEKVGSVHETHFS